ncbi:MAG: glutaredoxin family protein [Methylophagaceae bacterium]|jgi:glutaredoxin|tara:strand:+ start:1451 stop:1708 length:258 start_codon:yes stop_codon:yes gene_type:complete
MTNVVVWSKTQCPYCDKAKAKLDALHVNYEVKLIGTDVELEDLLEAVPGARSVPQIQINGENIGGYTDLLTYIENTGFNGTGHTL